METSSGLISQPLRANGAFNWIYLTDWIVNGVLCLFFLFYFNRLFATVLLYGVRIYLQRSLKVYVDIQALQISPLAGRIFFKGIRYHGDNETIYVHGGYITWRYWLRSVKECQIYCDGDGQDNVNDNDGANGNERTDVDNSVESPSPSATAQKHKPAKKKASLPCRISIKVSGVEAFLYNRSPAYDAIVHGIFKTQSQNSTARAQSDTVNLAAKEKYGRDLDSAESHDPSSSASSSPQMPQPYKTSSWDSQTAADLGKLQPALSAQTSATTHAAKLDKPSPPAFLQLFPIHVECNKAAAVLGNDNTKSIITAKVDSASGEFDASESGPLDIFKILMSFHATHPYIQMKPNVDFKTTQLEEAAALKTSTEPIRDIEPPFSFARIGTLWNRLLQSSKWTTISSISFWPRGSAESVATRARTAKRYQGLPFVKSDVPGNGKWLGLLRYLNDDENDEHDEWGPVEYAKSSVLADINAVDFKFYWDIPGTVRHNQANSSKRPAFTDNINGSATPEYGMEIVVHGGQVNYGPWSDRHRIILQQMFFPAPFADAVPMEPLRPGAIRLFTEFKLSLRVKDEVVVRIPFRESSKDANWKGRAAALTGQRQNKADGEGKRKGRARRNARSSKRQTAGAGTDVRPFAWFDIRVADTTVNYSMDMYPGRTGYRNKLSVDVSGIDIFSSLNHGLLWHCQRVGMECDLSNPLAWNGLRTWIFNININRLDFYLLRDHTFLLVDLIEDWSSGPLPDFYTFAPYRYKLNVHFQDYKLFLNTNDANIVDNADSLDDNDFVILYGQTLDADLLIPLDRLRPVDNAITFQVTSTELGFELCMPPKSTISDLLLNKNVAQLSSVEVNGAYTYCSVVQPGLTETLNLEIIGKSLKIDFYGFLARHLAKIKENYFGESVHFRTLNEYQDLVRRNFEDADAEHPVTKSNDLDVILDIIAEDVNINLPSGLYDSEEHVKVRVDRADVDLRVNNYYLELMVNSNPLELSYTMKPSSTVSTVLETSGTQLFIDGVKVFGHRLFGLPPSEPPYVSNWDVDAGAISGECSTAFVEKTVAAAQSFALTVVDAENAVPLSHYTPLYDSDFVRFACPEIRIWCRSEQAAFLASTQRISGSFNNLAGRLFSQQLTMTIPNLTVACVDADSLLRRRSQELRVAKTFAYFSTTVSMSMVQRSLGFQEQRRLQQEHIYLHDTRRDDRATFLIKDKAAGSIRSTPADGRKDILSLDLPPLPTPLSTDVESVASIDGGVVSENNYSSPTNQSQYESVKVATYHSSEIPPTPGHGRFGSFSREISSSAAAFSSPFKSPYFSLLDVEPDLSDVPQVEATSQSFYTPDPAQPYDAPIFDSSIDEDTVHTAFILSVAPAITAYCTPEAVRSVAVIVDEVQPKRASQLLDNFHFKTINEVFAYHAKRRGKNSLVDLSMRVPQLHLRFVNHLQMNLDTTGTPVSDRYNAILNDIIVSVRLKTVPARQHESDANCMHATLGSLQILAEEGSANVEKEHAAFKVNVDDVLVWLVDSDRTSVHASFHTTEVATRSKKVEYLANLVHRTTMLANEFQSRFTEIFERQQQRLKYLFFNLTTLSAQNQDPSFLTRPSYVIRSSPDHLRNNDSWKILSHIRYNLLGLDPKQRIKLDDGCMNYFFDLPVDAETSALAKLDAWHNWDASQIIESFAVRIVYGSLAEIEKLHDRSKIPVGVTIRALSFRVVIDPGKKQNDLTLEQLAISVAISPPPPPSTLKFFKDVEEIKTTVVQLKTTKYNLELNWSICELVDRILELFERSPPTSLQHKEQLHELKSNEPRPEEFHIVLSSGSGVIRLEAINLIQKVTTTSPKISVSGTGWSPLDKDKSVNVILTAEQTVLESRGHAQPLFICRIVSPTIFFAYIVSAERDQVNEGLKIAGDCKEINFQVKDEIIGLIEVAHSILSDEVTYFRHLVERHEQASAQSEPQPAALPNKRQLHVSLALFLNIYTIEIALLDDIVYATTGRTARLSVSPNSKIESMYQMDYDLKAQSHQLLTGVSQDQAAVATIGMPPINGTLKLILSSNATRGSGMLTVEKIRLDGAALYGILNVLSSAKIQPAFEAIKADGLAVQEKIASLFPKSKVAQAQKDRQAKPFIFDAGFVLAGIAITADAPSAAPEAHSSNVLIDVQRIHLRASNQAHDEGLHLPFPEIRFAIQEIGIELRQIEGDELRLSGKLSLSVQFDCRINQQLGKPTFRNFVLSVEGPGVEVNAATAPLLVDIMIYLQERMKGLDLSKEKKYLSRFKRSGKSESLIGPSSSENREAIVAVDSEDSGIRSSFSFELKSLRIAYVIDDTLFTPVSHDAEDLVLTLKSIRLLASQNADARLNIEDLQLALVHQSGEVEQRPANSALLPEMIFKVAQKSTNSERKLVFQAAGKTLDLQLDPQFVLPISDVERSITLSSRKAREAAANLKMALGSGGLDKKKLFAAKNLSSLIIDADFDGTVVHLQAAQQQELRKPTMAAIRPQHGRYGQFAGDNSSTQATLRAPGIALKIRYEDSGKVDSSLNIECKIDGSTNVLHPAVVPLILQISDSVKKVVREPAKEAVTKHDDSSRKPEQKIVDEESIVQADPKAVLGKTRLNLGIRICRQEFSLSCQPIAKVDAYAKLEDIYITVNDIQSEETGHFFAASAAITGLQASLKHVYSREATFSFDIQSIVLSLMNSKHISGTTGISAILKINPTRTEINAKQLQDVLLFREIWLPPEIRHSSTAQAAASSNEPQDYFVQRYQQVAAAAAFPWNATVDIVELKLDVDLGQSIGKTSLRIVNLWACSRKMTSSRQTLCVGIDEVGISSSGRMSGFVDLEKVKIRTSIAWPESDTISHTPLIQGAIGFDQLRVKAAFDYQAFAVANVSSFEFLMYNVRDPHQKSADRLVAILDGDKVSVYCIAASAAHGLSLVQAFERLVQEKQTAYEQSLKDIEKFLRRRPSVFVSRTSLSPLSELSDGLDDVSRTPISLQTDVIVTLRSLDVGAFPSTLLDRQVLRAEASDVQTRFAVALEEGKIHSGLGLTLGQLRVALASVTNPSMPKTLGDITIEEVVRNAATAKGGVILRVPRVVAAMQTWQGQDSNVIDYVFKSSFEGKIDVGWNYSRISFIRGMWGTHARTFAARLGKPLPEPAVKITGAPKAQLGWEAWPDESPPVDQGQQKITAEVSLPQSKYIYRAMEPPIIETPQLRDMGEATPPLEWVGLHRDRLPNVTHQIVIVTLLELSKEVEDAYSRILGAA